MSYQTAKRTYRANEEWKSLQQSAGIMDTYATMGASLFSLLGMALIPQTWGFIPKMLASGLSSAIGRGLGLEIGQDASAAQVDQSDGLFYQTARKEYDQMFDPWGDYTKLTAVQGMMASGVQQLSSLATDWASEGIWGKIHERRMDKGKKIWFPGFSDSSTKELVDPNLGRPKLSGSDSDLWAQDVKDLDDMLNKDLENQPGYPEFESPPLDDFSWYFKDPKLGRPNVPILTDPAEPFDDPIDLGGWTDPGFRSEYKQDLFFDSSRKMKEELDLNIDPLLGRPNVPIPTDDEFFDDPINLFEKTDVQNKAVNTILQAMRKNSDQKMMVIPDYSAENILDFNMNWADMSRKEVNPLPVAGPIFDGKLKSRLESFKPFENFNLFEDIDNWDLFKGKGKPVVDEGIKDKEAEIKKEQPIMQIPTTKMGDDFNWVTEIEQNYDTDSKRLKDITFKPFENWKPFNREWREKNKKFLYKDFKPGWFEGQPLEKHEKKLPPLYSDRMKGKKVAAEETVKDYKKNVSTKVIKAGDPEYYHHYNKEVTDSSKSIFQRKKKYVGGASNKELNYIETKTPIYSQKGLPSLSGIDYETIEEGLVNVSGGKRSTFAQSGVDLRATLLRNPLTGDVYSYNIDKGIWDFTSESKRRKFLPNVFGEWK